MNGGQANKISRGISLGRNSEGKLHDYKHMSGRIPLFFSFRGEKKQVVEFESKPKYREEVTGILFLFLSIKNWIRIPI